jgi:hypothetical protein
MLSPPTKNHNLMGLFLFGTLCFTDFTLTKSNLRLEARGNISNDIVEFLLYQLCELTNLEFFAIYQKNNIKVIDIYCLSDPVFFSKMTRVFPSTKRG